MGKVFITYDALNQRLAGAGGQMIELAHDEHLTPGALDLVQQRGLTVRRSAPPEGCVSPPVCVDRSGESCRPASQGRAEEAATRAGLASAQAAGAVGLAVDRSAGPTVHSLVASLGGGRPLDEFEVESCFLANLRAMCQAVAAGRLAGGVALASCAAEAVVLANKVRGVRAVQGVSLAALAGAMPRVAPNVLVLELPGSTFHEARSMIGAFVAGVRGPDGPAGLRRLIEQLEAGG